MTQGILQIQSVQTQLGDLSNQLATGKKSLNLADYTITDSNKVLNLRSVAARKQSFLDAINTVEPQLKVYDSTFDELDDVGNNALALVNQATDITQTASTAAGTQFQGMLDDIQYFLNQKLGSRYIFGGARYGTAPVANLNGLAVPPVETGTVSSPTLPTYDSAAPGSDANAYTPSTVRIDDNFTVTYGISSDNPAFQQLILGIRWAYAATQETTDTAFNTDMGYARTLLAAAIPAMQSLHGQVASNISQLETTKTQHNNFISS
ncbi:MAG TPA: hypothetical protein VHB73_03335, partial [Alphaproteobacteria bacterium]|nr:hypothetical protein [Alphaproteobacteria bacterium]